MTCPTTATLYSIIQEKDENDKIDNSIDPEVNDSDDNFEPNPTLTHKKVQNKQH